MYLNDRLKAYNILFKVYEFKESGKEADMQKTSNRNLNSGCRCSVVLGIGLLALSLMIGCASPQVQRYDKISFAWTSDHHLPPNQRFLTIDTPPETAAGRIKKWAAEKNGEIIESNDHCGTITKLQPDGEKSFLEAQGIVKREWAAYDQNIYRKWEEGEWQRLQQLSKSQVEFINAQDGQPICLKIQLGKRQKQISYKVQVGTTTTYHQTYIYTQNGMIPGARIPMNQPKYETRTTNVSIVSQIDFFIFSEQGLTRIYAVGAPFDVGTSVKAAYGATIGHSCWPMITGKNETSLIKEAYTYLINADSQ